MQYGRKIIIDTGGDFSEGNRPQVRAQRVRVKNTAQIRENTAPVPDVSNLADTNFISATMSGNLVEAPAENASSSLIASKNRMMAEQVQHLNRNKDYMSLGQMLFIDLIYKFKYFLWHIMLC